MRKKVFEERLNEVYHVIDMLYKEGKSYAECRYIKIMAERLLLIHDSLLVIRTLLCGLIGFLIGQILSATLF